ncbi:uncharacterized protein N7443_008547 [Penicillium atrosanguineum]|uniref:Uncharacterized protein n=1 Tax=Penicillium atrosanguineum TaxID=1132637 RepID=A0A9W9PPS2_9EURO|nr:uncharacterized protein N7443_008547 [Penicillium atrosanguineum]KAJ5125477.1 hypothetical protein N7526_007654 [Penicillium atrosanguineum]KAJ5292594.1 hypothetical protein N7443_008547 [Penicillium atrosanguineum]KAJ5303382.1 hypothetical protein N7476_010181 [Penicillium atrosanguineum]
MIIGTCYLPGADAITNDPASQYLEKMCYPNLSNATRGTSLQLSTNEIAASLARSSFPCEQEMYIEAVCTANGTTPIDFLAEQECLCTGGYWEAVRGCNACNYAHGYRGSPSISAAAFEHSTASYVSSISAAECHVSPPYQPFSNLLPTVNITSLYDSPSITLASDRFPNNTAVSKYFTATRSMTPGNISGSATARLTSWTNYSGLRYTPTSTPDTTGSPSTSTSATSISAAGSSATNGARAGAVMARSGRCLLAVMLGFTVL